MNIAVRLIVVLMFLLLAVGCAVAPRTPPPPETPAVPASPAALSLLDRARQQTAAGDLEQAGASLERALRIEPRNPLLWQELARVRLGQGAYRQAESLATRANGLAAGNRGLRAECWRLIGQARSARGDHQGAQAAFDRAESP